MDEFFSSGVIFLENSLCFMSIAIRKVAAVPIGPNRTQL
jgi:hypothetical protein